MDSTSAVQQLTPASSDLGHTPVVVKPSSIDRSRGYEEGEPNANLRRHNKFLKLDSEMEWTFIKTTDWMSTCLTGVNSDSDTAFQPFNVTLNKNEAAMYPGLCKGLNTILEQIGCTKFLTYCTAEYPDKSVSESDTLEVMDTSQSKIDLSILPKKYAKLRTKVQKANEPSIQPATGGPSSSSSPTPSSLPPSGIPPNSAPNSPNDSIYPPSATTAEDSANPVNIQETVSDRSQSELQPPWAECSWHHAEVLVEAKLNSRNFPFPQHNPMSQGAEHRQSRGQLASYALQVLRMQHRNHIFLISISGESARLLRFDRSGAIVSESFNYTTEAGVKFIGQFLYHLFCPSSTPEDRGADSTATPASDVESEFFSSLHSQFPLGGGSWIAQKHFKNALGADETWPIYALNITSSWSELGSDQTAQPVRKDGPLKTHRCLVGKPMFTSRSLMGRGTKCFVGWDLDANRPVMIKDSWRADLSDIESELDTYITLWEGKKTINSTYIPTPLGGGDVYHADSAGDTREYQRTLALTAPVLPYIISKSQRTPRIHTRLVLKEICESLENFTGAEELVIVVFNALMAHFHAWNTHKILHRDISVHNILIYYPNGDSEVSDPSTEADAIGLLADWDLARTESQLQQGPVLPARSGTWQTMSSLLQFMREKHYEVSDDLESFMHVLNWCALRYLPNQLSNMPSQLTSHLHGLFDFHGRQKLEDETFVSIGALRKLNMITAGQPFVKVKPPGHPFGGLLKDLAILCQEHYATYDIDSIIAKAQGLEDPSQQKQPEEVCNKWSSSGKITSRSEMSLEFLGDSYSGALKSTALVEPSTPTRRSPHPSGPQIRHETLQSSNAIILNSPPPTPQISSNVKDRSESPLLNHTKFMKTIWNILQSKIAWDLLPRCINALEPQSLTSVLDSKGSESGSSTGGSKRPLAGDDEDDGSKQKKSKRPSPSRGSPDSDDPFLYTGKSPAAASSAVPGTRFTVPDENPEGNAATQLFDRANPGESKPRPGRRSSRSRSSPATSPASSHSTSSTGSG